MDRRPPLAVSPRRLRPRPHRAPRPPLVPSSCVKSPPGSMKKAGPMHASMCSIPSPVRPDPSPIRASISAFPSPPIRAVPSPLRSSVSALQSPLRFDMSPPRGKLDLHAAAAAAATPSPARSAAGKENILPAAAAVAASSPFWKENILADVGADHDERVALELAALARAASPVAGPLFVRGRLYGAYSARRNERLKRKHGFPYGGDWAPAADPEEIAQDPYVAVELSKRRGAKKAATGSESVRRSMPAVGFAAGRASSGLVPRSSLRVNKEMKKATAASGATTATAAVSTALKERRVNPRSSARRF